MVNLGVYRLLNKKDFCLKDKTFVITLKEKPRELFKVDASLREDSLKLKWKWTGKMEEEKFWQMELSCKPMASEVQMENRRTFEELMMKSRFFSRTSRKILLRN